MHAAHQLPGKRLADAPGAELALRHNSELLDATDGFRPGGSVLPSASGSSGDYLGAIARQCWRFIDSDLDYDPEASSCAAATHLPTAPSKLS